MRPSPEAEPLEGARPWGEVQRARSVRINLHLNCAWYLLTFQRFLPIGAKRSFRQGDLLYCASNMAFYTVVPEKKKLAYATRGQVETIIRQDLVGTRGLGRQSPSKRKVILVFDGSKCQNMKPLLRQDLSHFELAFQEAPPRPRYTGYPWHLPQASSYLPDFQAEQRAKKLFQSLMATITQVQIEGKWVRVKSQNGETYQVDLSTGRVYHANGGPICVYVSEREILPLYDKIIAKALTIAFAPDKISTLKKWTPAPRSA